MGDAANIFMIPLVANFKRKFGKTDDDMKFHIIPMYVKALSKYSDETLSKAIKIVYSTSPNFPELEYIHKICERVINTQESNAVYIHQLSEAEILKSDEGKKALSAGHGNNYLIACRDINKIVPAEPIIKACSDLDYGDLTGKYLDMLLKHEGEMKVRETELKDRYLI
jgi:hypothetical protein